MGYIFLRVVFFPFLDFPQYEICFCRGKRINLKINIKKKKNMNNICR